MKREIAFGVAAMPRKPAVALLLWSVPEALPASLSGLAVAHAVDSGFLADRPAVGLGWLALLLVAAGLGAIGSRQVYRLLGGLVEPFRDLLVRKVVGGALGHAVRGKADDGAIARLTHQVEIVRDTYAGLIVVLRGFLVTVIGVVIGMLSVDPVIVALLLPPFLLGLGAFLATLGMAADRFRRSVRADEQLAVTAGAVLAGTRDIAATGAEEHAAAMTKGPIEAQADAERAIATVAAVRSLCLALGGWVPLVVLLVAGPWLVSRGLTAGAVMGGLTYVLIGLQPVLRNLMTAVGGSGLRYAVTLGRILDAAELPSEPEPRAHAGQGDELAVRGLTFAYGPHAEPVLRDLDLVVPPGDHLAIVGPSGIGKSTLAGLLCGLLRPGEGAVLLGGVPVADLPADQLARGRTLIPQEAYVFAGGVWDNLTYLAPDADPERVAHAITAVGADALVARIGGVGATLVPAELSAGERQQVALVRAYLSPAPVVVLDEATCHLDPVAERRAEEAFAERGGTLIVIAHRVSSALRARRVLVLDGTGAAVGDHRTLQETSPLYRDLLGHWNPDRRLEEV
ncbi:ATP-binding cassette domain-containing protein [Labedaea rhizosphaerae]|uniref:ATP-binding cassette subfamily C protein n=1 Tax=Labedaea rhizosphaerae TaxID=598644 RepID=A0A4R6SF88_LABRH|nr:ABC transporter ATP-binding protein [Labedaea rhizosphaerae]TDQ00224.1 ATP-binding cassette subfamily C protein [Labedaea rhizosphaerae]